MARRDAENDDRAEARSVAELLRAAGREDLARVRRRRHPDDVTGTLPAIDDPASDSSPNGVAPTHGADAFGLGPDWTSFGPRRAAPEENTDTGEPNLRDAERNATDIAPTARRHGRAAESDQPDEEVAPIRTGPRRAAPDDDEPRPTYPPRTGPRRAAPDPEDDEQAIAEAQRHIADQAAAQQQAATSRAAAEERQRTAEHESQRLAQLARIQHERAAAEQRAEHERAERARLEAELTAAVAAREAHQRAAAELQAAEQAKLDREQLARAQAERQLVEQAQIASERQAQQEATRQAAESALRDRKRLEQAEAERLLVQKALREQSERERAQIEQAQADQRAVEQLRLEQAAQERAKAEHLNREQAAQRARAVQLEAERQPSALPPTQADAWYSLAEYGEPTRPALPGDARSGDESGDSVTPNRPQLPPLEVIRAVVESAVTAPIAAIPAEPSMTTVVSLPSPRAAEPDSTMPEPLRRSESVSMPQSQARAAQEYAAADRAWLEPLRGEGADPVAPAMAQPVAFDPAPTQPAPMQPAPMQPAPPQRVPPEPARLLRSAPDPEDSGPPPERQESIEPSALPPVDGVNYSTDDPSEPPTNKAEPAHSGLVQWALVLGEFVLAVGLGVGLSYVFRLLWDIAPYVAAVSAPVAVCALVANVGWVRKRLGLGALPLPLLLVILFVAMLLVVLPAAWSLSGQ